MLHCLILRQGLRLGKFTRLLRVLRVAKLLRILKIMKLSPMLKKITAISGQNFLRFVSVVGSALLLLHLMACSFFMAANLYHQDVLAQIGPITDDNMKEKLEQAWESTWVGMAGLANESSVNRCGAAILGYRTSGFWVSCFYSRQGSVPECMYASGHLPMGRPFSPSWCCNVRCWYPVP